MPHGHILKGQLQISSVPSNLSTYSAAHVTNRLTGMVWGPLSGFGLCVILRCREVRQGRAARG